MEKPLIHVCLVCHTEPDVWDGGFKSVDVVLPEFMDILGEIRDSRGVSPRVAWCLTGQVARQRPDPFLRLLEGEHEIGVHSHFPAENGLLEHEQEINRQNLESFETWLPELCEIIRQAGFPVPKTHVTWMFAYRNAITLALAASDIDIDCSVCSGGAHYMNDGFLLADSRKRFDGRPYRLDRVNHCSKGDSTIIELPVSGGFGSCWEPDTEGGFSYFTPVASDDETARMMDIFNVRVNSLLPDEIDIFHLHFHLYDFLTPGGLDEERLNRAGRILWLMARDKKVRFSTPSAAVKDWLSSK